MRGRISRCRLASSFLSFGCSFFLFSFEFRRRAILAFFAARHIALVFHAPSKRPRIVDLVVLLRLLDRAFPTRRSDGNLACALRSRSRWHKVARSCFYAALLTSGRVSRLHIETRGRLDSRQALADF